MGKLRKSKGKRTSNTNHVSGHKSSRQYGFAISCAGDDTWAESFCYLNVYDFCTVGETCKRFYNLTLGSCRKNINNYWKYQIMLIGLNENFLDNIYDNTIKPSLTFFTPAHNDWKKCFVEFYNCLSEFEFISKISRRDYYNNYYNYNYKQNFSSTKRKKNSNGRGKSNIKRRDICVTFIPHESKKKSARSSNHQKQKNAHVNVFGSYAYSCNYTV